MMDERMTVKIVPIKTYAIDFDKIQTLEDIKTIFKVFRLTFYEDVITDDAKHLFTEVGDNG